MLPNLESLSDDSGFWMIRKPWERAWSSAHSTISAAERLAPVMGSARDAGLKWDRSRASLRSSGLILSHPMMEL